MATASTAPESPKITDLRHQLREASTFDARFRVMANTMRAVRDNEISTTESEVLNKEFKKMNNEALVRTYETRRAELDAAAVRPRR